MSEFFSQEYQKNNPEHSITELSLYKEGISFLNEKDLADMMLADKGDFAKYVDQFLEHDKYIIAAPFWNLSIPAILRAYLDRIITVGKTFSYTETGPQPLHPSKSAAFFMARGGFYPANTMPSMEYGLSYWRALSSTFLGLNTSAFLLEGTQVCSPEETQRNFEDKKKEIRQKALTF